MLKHDVLQDFTPAARSDPDAVWAWGLSGGGSGDGHPGGGAVVPPPVRLLQLLRDGRLQSQRFAASFMTSSIGRLCIKTLTL